MIAKRERPADGGIVWHGGIHAFQCLGCEEWIEMRKRSEYDDPEHLAATKELLIADHTECWEFSDPRMAADARKYRKERKRRALLSGQNLAAQRTSWRGRA